MLNSYKNCIQLKSFTKCVSQCKLVKPTQILHPTKDSSKNKRYYFEDMVKPSPEVILHLNNLNNHHKPIEFSSEDQ